MGNTPAFMYLKQKFPKMSEAKIKEGIFVGPQVRSLMHDEKFEELLNPLEEAAWQAFKNEGSEIPPMNQVQPLEALATSPSMNCAISTSLSATASGAADVTRTAVWGHVEKLLRGQ
ncbi:hypothetical protein TNCV_5101001 [Trichonephila clavipes]|uniref:Uncharacterized protein n=1 Tax=Trichonephila clavipes TaxID=2585209 RepID=A0A8X6S589_TRICX|nr:hypothetical protein TNCV_5101001 [Trichonephila clavipes]